MSDFFPHLFKLTPDFKSIYSLWFDSAKFAQLAVSNIRPHQCKSFSKLRLSACPLNIADDLDVCKCLGPVNFFTHALITLTQGNYSRDVKEAVEKLGNYMEEAG